MDLNLMLKPHKVHSFISCIIGEVTNYIITVHTYHSRSEEIHNSLTGHVISKYCILEYITMDQTTAFMSSLINYLFKKFNIKIKTIAPYNHQSLQAEHGISSLSTILTNHLTDLGQL